MCAEDVNRQYNYITGVKYQIEGYRETKFFLQSDVKEQLTDEQFKQLTADLISIGVKQDEIKTLINANPQ